MKRYIKIQLILFACFFSFAVRAQVTIGFERVPEEAALLQVKENEPNSPGDATARRGILLPRVKLNSLSDITLISPNADPDKIADLTGLLVYNVNKKDEMEEGIYEWNGDEWEQLGIQSEKDGAYTKKSVAWDIANSFDESGSIVSIGRFSFRFSSGKIPQCKMDIAPSMDEEIGYHIARFGNNNGYSYQAKAIPFTPNSYGWHDIYSSAINNDERWEVWLADQTDKKVYNIQFITYKMDSDSIYFILVTEY
ncbi:MAG: hypothetical protein LBC48_03240 [Dysgonamonadaceae bacterium]|jgi:hypothetical protein|nr:hypothetical protein [Dysgonamonadaceae bacterium]